LGVRSAEEFAYREQIRLQQKIRNLQISGFDHATSHYDLKQFVKTISGMSGGSAQLTPDTNIGHELLPDTQVPTAPFAHWHLVQKQKYI